MKSVAGYYDAVAEDWDAYVHGKREDAENKSLVKLLKGIDFSSVLELACGTGLLLDYQEVGRYTGVDISPGMIKVAQANHPNTTFLVEDQDKILDRLYAMKGFYSTVLNIFAGFSYSKDCRSYITQCLELLAPGGTVVVMPYGPATGRCRSYSQIYNDPDSVPIRRIWFKNELIIFFGQFGEVDVIPFVSSFAVKLHNLFNGRGAGLINWIDRNFFAKFLDTEFYIVILRKPL